MVRYEDLAVCPLRERHHHALSASAAIDRCALRIRNQPHAQPPCYRHHDSQASLPHACTISHPDSSFTIYTASSHQPNATPPGRHAPHLPARAWTRVGACRAVALHQQQYMTSHVNQPQPQSSQSCTGKYSRYRARLGFTASERNFHRLSSCTGDVEEISGTQWFPQMVSILFEFVL